MDMSFLGDVMYRDVLKTANTDLISEIFRVGLETSNPILGVPAMEELLHSGGTESVIKSLSLAFDQGQLKAGSAMINAITNSLRVEGDPVLREYARGICNGFLGSPIEWVHEHETKLKKPIPKYSGGYYIPDWVKKELGITTK